MRKVSLPVITISDTDLHWLAGIIEGEGCFTLSGNKYCQPTIKIGMTDHDIMLKVHKLLSCGTICERKSNNGYKTQWIVRVYSKDAVEWMNILYPLMGSRRKLAIEEVLSKTRWKSPRNKINNEIADNIRLLLSTTKLSQREIGDKYGITAQQVSNISRGLQWKVLRIN